MSTHNFSKYAANPYSHEARPFRELQNLPLNSFHNMKPPSPAKSSSHARQATTGKFASLNLFQENEYKMGFLSENVKPLVFDINFDDRVGILPEYQENQKAPIGSGASKTVSVVTALKSSLWKTKGGTGWKDIALAKQIYGNNKKGDVVELRVLKKLSENEQAGAFTPKIYYAGIQNERLVTAKKMISGGDARHCLPYMSISDRLHALIGYANGLKVLHSEKIVHNDTALRNMLIELPKEVKNVDNALNFRLAKPIFDPSGKTLIESKELITKEIQERIKSLNIKEVKVFVNKMPKGILNDFDRCTFTDDYATDVLLGSALDCTAPERQHAVDEYKKAKESNQNLEEARKKVLLASNPSTDAFSFGQLLCDALLRPNLDTSLDDYNYQYKILCKERMDKRIQQYLSFPSNTLISAIDENDYKELCNIQPELGQIASKLLSYQSNKRPSIDEAMTVLKSVLPKCTHLLRNLSFEQLFTSYDAAKKLKLNLPQQPFSMFGHFSNEPTKDFVVGYDDDSE